MDPNSAAVGTARALSAVSSMAVAGLPDAPTAAPALNAAGGRSFYVDSAAGDDRNNGRAAAPGAQAGPWRSLARVMQSDIAAGDSLVLACGGQWRETLRLPASGSAAQPITVTMPAGCTNKPTIDGSTTFAADSWVRHSGNIYKAALDSAPSQLFASSGLFSEAHHPNRGHRASEPNSLYAALAGDGNVVTVDGRQRSSVLTVGSDLALPAGTAIAAGTRLRVLTESWLIEERTVAAVDGSRLTLSTPTSYPVAAGWGYFLLGQLWMLDAAGEWHHDPVQKQLYAWMPDSQPPAAVAVATLAVGIDLNNRSHVVVDGLVVRRVGSGILMRSSQNLRVRNSVFEDIAEAGADAALSTNAVFESNSFVRIGRDAISGQDDDTPPCTGLVARNNLVRDSGVVMQGDRVASLPRRAHAAIRSGSNAQVSGNVIVNAGYAGIFSTSGSTIEDNFVFGACSVLDDCAGIYAWASRDLTIRRNTVAQGRGSLAGKPAARRFTQAQGIYLDELSKQSLIEANTVINNDHGIQLHVSPNNRVRGNSLYGNRMSQIWLQETSNRETAAGDLHGNVVEGNQIAPTHPGSVGMLLETKFASTAAFGSFEANRYYDRGAPAMVVASTSAGYTAYSLSQWQASRSIGSVQAVDTQARGVANTGYTNYGIGGGNLVPNAALARDTAGWTHWSASTPGNQLVRESCTAGICLRFTGGAPSGLLSSPNFSLVQGQWYRLTLDLSTDQDAQPVQVVVRRGGGGSNGYESLSDRNLAVTAQRAWGRYTVVFQASASVTAGNAATGDLGARIDIEGILAGRTVALANLELVPIVPETLANTSGVLVNAGANLASLACPFTQASLCDNLVRLADDQPATWPLNVPPRSAVILYGQVPALRDSDGDGIADNHDRCAGTAVGAPANAAGCSFAQR